MAQKWADCLRSLRTTVLDHASEEDSEGNLVMRFNCSEWTELVQYFDELRDNFDVTIRHICTMIECAGNPTVVTAADPSNVELGNIEAPLAELVALMAGVQRNL